MDMIRLYCQLQDGPALCSTFLFDQLFTILAYLAYQNRFAPLGCPNKVIYDQVYSMFISLIVVIHIYSIPLINRSCKTLSESCSKNRLVHCR